MSEKVLDDKGMKEKIDRISKNIFESILSNEPPKIEVPLRSLNNVDYDRAKGYFEITGKTKERTLTASTIKTFAQTLHVMDLSKQLIRDDDMATKREAYYVSKNWGDARFKEQPESDNVMDDIEAMLYSIRESMGFIAGEKGGGLVAGELTVIDIEQDTKKEIEIDCTKFGSGAYSIPSILEHFKFKTSSKFILVVETMGMFERLNKHKFWKNQNCIIVGIGGVPTRSTRRFIRKLSDDKKLPVYVFTDGDPYGYLNIYRTLKVGSGNSAHINKFFCVPSARFLGVTPSDILDYDLPTHPLKEQDVKRIKDGMKNDPFVKEYKEWQKALADMSKLKQRVEQQAFAKHGLNMVMEKYLPEKIANQKSWLP